MLTPTQLKYIELDKKKEEYKAFLEEFKNTSIQLAKEIGINGHFQDHEGTVYQVCEAEGKYIIFDKIEVKRTRRPNERAGSLSLVAAKGLGYDV